MRAHTQSAAERRSAARGKKCAELTGREGRSEAEKPDTEVGEREREGGRLRFYSERQRRGREKRREEGRELKQKERSLEKERVRGCTSWSRSEKIQRNAFN